MPPKKIKVPAIAEGRNTEIDVYISNDSKDGVHPLQHQESFHSKKNVKISEKMMENIFKLKNLAEEQNVSFEEVCEYVVKAANQFIKQMSGDKKDIKKRSRSKFK